MMQTLFLLIIMEMVSKCKGANPVVNTTHGPVEGLEISVFDKLLDVFYGIPYAKPPVGNLRFRRPESPETWTETKRTQSLPNSCHQTIDTKFDRFPGVEMWNPNTKMSEDCLYLNLWKPKPDSADSKLAVMVWIFGGSFSFGTINLDVYNGQYLAVQNDVVVVSMNYRLGALGFLYMGTEEVPGNVGLLDQSLAVKWVYDNVEKFGGDKNRITIFGESAGSSCVHYHLLSRLSRDYFTNAIMESGTSLSYWSLFPKPASLQRTARLAHALNCPGADTESWYKCLVQTDAQTLVTKQWDVVEYFFDVPFAPVVDGYFITAEPEDLLSRGDIKNTSIILGVNKDEGGYFLLYGIPEFFKRHNQTELTRDEFIKVEKTVLKPLDTDDVVTVVTHTYEKTYLPKDLPRYLDIIDDIAGDRAFKCPTVDLARIYSELGNDVYLYSFEYRLSGLSWPAWMGVPHGYEVEFVFGITTNGSENYSTKDKTTSLSIMSLWTELAKTGNLSSKWPKYDIRNQKYLQINSTGNINQREGLRHSQCALWREVIPLLSKEGDAGVKCVNGSRSRNYDASFLVFIGIISFTLHVKLYLWRYE